MQSIPRDTKKERDVKKEEHLIVYTKHLEKRLRNLETEISLLEAERIKLEKELNDLRYEFDQLRKPALMNATIIDVLDDRNNRAIVTSSSGPSFVVKINQNLKSEKLTAGMSVALNQNTLKIVEILPTNLDPFVKGMELIDSIPDISYQDVGGLEDQIQEVKETVELPLKNPDVFKRIGVDPPKGVLFFGPPGTGKTLLAKAVAHETDATFIRVISSELVQKFIGEGARYVREIFNLARQKAPTILFIDELDAIAAERMEDATSGDREVQRTLMQLMAELDGFDNRGDVKFIGATNRADILDPALLRPGRFDRIIEFPIPDDKAREAIFKVHMRALNIQKDVNLNALVNLTKMATGADIKAICTEAGMFAIRRDADIITKEDFSDAINKIMNIDKIKSSRPEFFI
ncbi:MAG: proteasome-activating nucleotidase [Promethearchaeota archaeon]|nr:MAG: proteasome-activating nucleotidase [Candidatus Lokiarchaeota archaeon]